MDSIRQALETALGDRYRIVRLLGRGGMGAVFLAREQALERLVAIKVLATAATPDEEIKERFRREARMAAGLAHANIVPLHTFGEVDGMLYLVMGFVSGESLRERLKRDQRVPEAEARRILADVAEALDYAHRHGVVHRDVKPDNILVEDESGRAFLADFGIAKGMDAGQELTQDGQVMGTPLYMSPEQAAGKDVDARSDLYSLGAVAFTMLAGRPPFETKTMQEAILRRHTEDAPSLGKVAPGVPADLAAATDRCLARDPQKRFENARAFRQAVSPDALVEDDLPEPLDTLDGKVVQIVALLLAVILAGAALLAAGAERDYRQRHGETTRGIDLMIVLFIGLGGIFVMQTPILISAARTARKRGFTTSQIVGAFLRQPRGWPFWFPRRFRRKDDVWDRLPGPFRAWRVLSTLFAADLLFWIALFFIGRAVEFMDFEKATKQMEGVGLAFLITVSFGILKWLLYAWGISLLLVLLATPFTLFFCARLMHRQGFDTYDLRRVSRTMLLGPTSDKTPWRKPEVARLLLPRRSREVARAVEPETPTQIVQAMVRLSVEVSGNVRGLASEAAETARALVASLSNLDAEVARIGADLDPSESERLRGRIAKLGSAGKAEEADRRELRELLEKQLDLQERGASEQKEALARRARLVSLLHELWQTARRLRSHDDSSAPDLLRRSLSECSAAVGATAPEAITSTSITLDRG